mmetsp:Transcript_7608/g.16664  ORF Transcript_7608/g.16664 Transcript_7608/m.16664 type:complete len:240 (-) Transcript_7608:1131-1850(-)
MRDKTFVDSSALLLSFFSSSLSSSLLACALSSSTPRKTCRTSGEKFTSNRSKSRSCFSRTTSSFNTEADFLSACCRSIRLAAEPSSASLPSLALWADQASKSCNTESLQRPTARHCAAIFCSKATTLATVLTQGSAADTQWEDPSFCTRRSWIESSMSFFSSNNLILLDFSSNACSRFLFASASRAFRSSSCCFEAFSLSSHVCFMNRSISSIWASYFEVSATPLACSMSLALRASTSS